MANLPPLPKNASIAQIEADFNAAGYDGAAYASWAQAAIAKDPALSPYNAALAWFTGTGLAKAVGTAAAGTGKMLGQVQQGAQNTNYAPPNPLSGLAAIGDFFGRLGQASTWIRVAEVLLGVILLAVGVAELTNAVPVATKIAKAVR